MTSTDPDVRNAVGQAMGKGCLAGIGLVVGFFVIGALIYGLLSLVGVTGNIRLFVTVAGGPIIGTVIAFIVAMNINRRQAQNDGQGDGSA